MLLVGLNLPDLKDIGNKVFEVLILSLTFEMI